MEDTESDRLVLPFNISDAAGEYATRNLTWSITHRFPTNGMPVSGYQYPL